MTSDPIDDGPGRSPRIGRPRGFDRDRLLVEIIDLFSRHGYEGLSIADLAASLGISHPSLYAAFGPKPALYRKALDHYAATWTAQARTALSSPCLTTALQDLLDLQVRALSGTYASRGSMLSAALLTSGPERAVEARHAATLRSAMIRTVRARFEKAVMDRAIARTIDTTLLATCVVGLIHGMSILSRDGATPSTLSAVGRIGLTGILHDCRMGLDDLVIAA